MVFARDEKNYDGYGMHGWICLTNYSTEKRKGVM